MSKTENFVLDFFVYDKYVSFMDKKSDNKHKLGFLLNGFFIEIFLYKILRTFFFDN